MKRHHPTRAGRVSTGMVLIDAIVGAVMIAVALAVIVGLGGRAISSQAEGEQLRIAAMLMDEQLSKVLAFGPDRYASRFGDRGACDAPYANYSYELDIRGGAAGDPYDVTVTVRWVASGRERSESLSTKIAPRLGDEPDPDRRPQQTVERTP